MNKFYLLIFSFFYFLVTPSFAGELIGNNSDDCEEIQISPIEFERQVCEGDSFSLAATVTGSDLVYQWQYSIDNGTTWLALVNDSVYSGVATSTLIFDYSYLIFSGFYYRLLVTNDCSVENSTSFVLTVIAKPLVNIAPTDGLNFCIGDTTGATSFSNGSYVWSNGALTAQIEITTPGDYYMVATLNGCVDTSNILTFIEHDYPTASFTASGTSFCSGDSVLLTSAYSTGSIWSNGAFSEQVYIKEGGEYFLIVDQFGCVDTSSVELIEMLPLPIVTLSPLAEICSTDPIVTFLTGHPVGGDYFVDGIQMATFNPQEGVGLYHLTYVYSDGACTDSASLNFEVSPCSSVDFITENELEIFPNPFQSYFTVQGSAMLKFEQLEIYDYLGRMVERIVINSDDLKIQTDRWESGVYILQFVGNEKRYSHRVQKI